MIKRSKVDIPFQKIVLLTLAVLILLIEIAINI